MDQTRKMTLLYHPTRGHADGSRKDDRTAGICNRLCGKSGYAATAMRTDMAAYRDRAATT
jgi:hypothetical protein